MADGSRKRRLLVCGAVEGRFDAVFSKVKDVCESKGPFDVLVACGRFFGPEGSDGGSFQAYLDGDKALPPCTVLFHEAAGAPPALELEPGSPREFCDGKIRYLGRCGVAVEPESQLKVAFCGEGTTASDGDATCGQGGSDAVDFIVASRWPAGVLAGVPADRLPPLSPGADGAGGADGADGANGANGAAARIAAACAELARRMSPRYIFAAGEGAFFARAPYANAAPRPGQASATRFVGLAPVSADAGADKARKWLHAVAIKPAALCDQEELSKVPAAATPSPFLRPPAPAPLLPPPAATSAAAPRFDARRIEAEEARMARGSRNAFFGGGAAGRKRRRLDAPVDAQSRSVFVGNVPAGATAEALRGAFARAGPVSDARVIEGKGFGFVDFETHEAAGKAVAELHESALCGAVISVGWASSAPASRASARRGALQPPPADPDARTVFVAPSHGAAEAEITAALGAFGDLRGVRTSEKWTFAFAEFETHAGAARAVAGGSVALGGGEARLRWGTQPPRGAQGGGAGGAAPRYPRDERVQCWFCLANDELQAHLIAHVGAEVYVATPKGALSDLHCLVVPIAHVRSVAELGDSAAAELESVKGKLRAAFAAKGLYPMVWERCVDTRGAHHAHVQVVPLPADAANRLAEELQRRADACGGLAFEEVGAAAPAEALRGAGQYLYVELPRPGGGAGTVRLLHRVPEGSKRKLPLHFGRMVAAAAMGNVDRAHWKACVVSEAQETAQAAKLKDAVGAQLAA